MSGRFLRCFVCREFFPAKMHACPTCGTEKRAVNAGLMGGRFAAALNAKAASAVMDDTF